jgi:hypothetical protein
MSVLVVGSVAFDTIETPHGQRERCLGGSASYFGLAARLFVPVQLVSVVGADFPTAKPRPTAARAAASICWARGQGRQDLRVVGPLLVRHELAHDAQRRTQHLRRLRAACARCLCRHRLRVPGQWFTDHAGVGARSDAGAALRGGRHHELLDRAVPARPAAALEAHRRHRAQRRGSAHARGGAQPDPRGAPGALHGAALCPAEEGRARRFPDRAGRPLLPARVPRGSRGGPHGGGSIMRMGDRIDLAIEGISTGSLGSIWRSAARACRAGASSRSSGRNRPARRR